MSLPLIFYYQMVRGLTPTQSALMMVPMALISGGLAPVVGKLIDRVNPKYIAAAGLVLMAVALFWNAALIAPGHADLAVPAARAPCWASPMPASGRRCPPPPPATCRPGRPAPAPASTTPPGRSAPCWVSAAIAALIQGRLAADLPKAPGASGQTKSLEFGGSLPDFLHAGFSTAMGQSIMLPAAVIVLGAAVVMFFAKPKPVSGWGAPPAGAAQEAPSRGVRGGE